MAGVDLEAEGVGERGVAQPRQLGVAPSAGSPARPRSQ